MKLLLCRVSVLTLTTFFWWAPFAARTEVLPAKGVVDPRVRQVSYNSEQVYRLRGYVGYQIDLQFEPGEVFVGLGAGDIEGVAFVAQDNHLFLKPKANIVGTNLTVLTNRRHYQFDYTASSRRPNIDEREAMYALRFSYPSPVNLSHGPSPAQRIETQLNAAAAQRTHNADYWFCGRPELQPVAASDDGVHTRLRFGVRGELPAIFVRNEDGSESLLNFSMEEGEVVVHRVARKFVVRRGKLTGCIVNKSYSGSGEQLKSGTIAPNVERSTPGGTP
jgi:type IV secretion system protein VirB9